ncbi:protein involved in polysaccharide export with SLBB domain [Runella defluvii]|uniref:Protein involved in polysaccharide export with SLBB domain n=1 Tax=Runella defluvii TaxID=370973 RepID=A0A7W6ENX5_9BACT|nr:SLBB domain-containing protein [Runella defluvii]MBB3836878.1 protein involved in polysaccharide export with SLBB domain [Runella defluvii]
MYLMKVTERIWLLSICLLFTGFSLLAQSQKSTSTSVNQLSDEQVLEFYKKAQASGLSEMQIEQAALERGYTLSDIARMRQRISEVQNKKTLTDKRDLSDSTTKVNGRKQLGDLSKREVLKKKKEDEDTLKQVKSKKLEIFGSKLFQSTDLTFEPNLRIATPKNYQLGPDDELVIDIFGNASDSYRLKVSPEGTVKVLNLAPVYVSGLTIEEAKERLVSRLRQAYSGLNSGGGTYAVVNLGNIRSIRVSIIGEVVKPGSYTVSSLATAFNALYLCGGPDSMGTYRNIRVLRNNKVVRTIDLYQFLLTGEQADNILLQDQDIIQVPFFTNRIELDGEIKRPAIYEIKENESLEQLLQFSGGFTSMAYRAYVTGRRPTDREIEVLNIPQGELKNFKLQNGDRIEVGKILLDRYQNRVQIQGAVFRPGDYALTPETKTFGQLLKKADGLKENAFRNRAVIFREKENGEPQVVSVDINKILKGEIPDIELHRQDSIVIKTIKELREEAFVTLLGEANSEGDAPYAEGMTVADLVLIGGGFTEGAIGSRIEIARRVKELNSDRVYKVEIIRLDIDPKLNLSPEDSKFKLQPFDIVYIRKAPNYEEQRSVHVMGEVNYPGTYAIVNTDEKISNLLERTGGIKVTGYLPGALFQRKGARIGIDIAQIMNNPSVEGNITLEDGDTLIVPKRSEIVSIGGAVLNPSSINFTKGYDFRDYLSQAGGYQELAQRGRGFITYANGFTQRTRRFLFFRIYPKVEPGSTIYVPFQPVDNKRSDITAPVILSFTSTLIIALATILRN